jgi:hypothetical protein
MFTRLIRFVNKPSAERSKLLRQKIKGYLRIPYFNKLRRTINLVSTWPFYFGKANLPLTLIAYQPDSHAHFSSHDEYYDLFKSFTANNKYNNAGDATRLWSLMLNIKQVLSESIQGDFAELGVWRGNTASVLAHYAAKSDRNVYLFDTFEGFNANDLAGVDKNKPMAFEDTSIEMVKTVIGDSSDRCLFVKGYFPASICAEHETKTYAIVSIDCDLYAPMKAGLEFFYPRMPAGGLLLLHDYSSGFWDGAKKATDEFCAEFGERVILMPDKSGSVFIRKSKKNFV